MANEESPKKRGPKGAIKHKPGRDHDRKSAQGKKKRFARKAARKPKETQQAGAGPGLNGTLSLTM